MFFVFLLLVRFFCEIASNDFLTGVLLSPSVSLSSHRRWRRLNRSSWKGDKRRGHALFEFFSLSFPFLRPLKETKRALFLPSFPVSPSRPGHKTVKTRMTTASLCALLCGSRNLEKTVKRDSRKARGDGREKGKEKGFGYCCVFFVFLFLPLEGMKKRLGKKKSRE